MDLRHWRPEKVGGEYRAGDIMLDAALYAAFQEVNPNNEERIYSGSNFGSGDFTVTSG
jgi:hypothetical protein